MRRIVIIVIVLVAALLVGTLLRRSVTNAPRETPVAASDTIRFDQSGVTMSVPRGLASVLRATEQPARPFVPDEVPEGVGPAHLEIVLEGFPASGVAGAEPAVVRVYATADFDRPEFGTAAANLPLQELTLLRETLAAPAGKGEPHAASATLPFLPLTPDAMQVVQARVERVESKRLRGIRYLTAYMQEMAPLIEGRVFYTFQGMTADGAHVVVATFPVQTGILPESIPEGFDDEAFAQEGKMALERTEAALDGQDESRYTPPLAQMDAIVRTIEIHGR